MYWTFVTEAVTLRLQRKPLEKFPSTLPPEEEESQRRPYAAAEMLVVSGVFSYKKSKERPLNYSEIAARGGGRSLRMSG